MHQYFCHRYWTDYSIETIDGILKFSNLKSVILIRFRSLSNVTSLVYSFLGGIPNHHSRLIKLGGEDQKRFNCFNSVWTEDSGIDSAEQSSKWTKLGPLNETNVMHLHYMALSSVLPYFCIAD